MFVGSFVRNVEGRDGDLERQEAGMVAGGRLLLHFPLLQGEKEDV